MISNAGEVAGNVENELVRHHQKPYIYFCDICVLIFWYT